MIGETTEALLPAPELPALAPALAIKPPLLAMLPQMPPHQRADYDAGKRHHYPHKRVVDQIAQLHNNDTTYKTIYTTLAP